MKKYKIREEKFNDGSFFLNWNTKIKDMDKDNKNTELDNTDKKLHISDVSVSLFNKLKDCMVEYTSLNSESSLDDEIEYHIKQYEKYINSIKTGYSV